jgi:hypothetical protein
MDATQNIKKHTYKKGPLNKKFGFLKSKYNASVIQHFPSLPVYTVTSFLTTGNTLRLTLSDPMSDLVQHYDFPVPNAFPHVVRTLAKR